MTLRRTPLHAEHAALGGKLVGFAGYEMPIQYAGITAEHQAVRTAAGLFDVSHMGEVEVSGPEALEFVQYLTTNDASRLAVGQAQYSTLLNERGGMLDDLLVYRFPEHYLLVVNAANRHADVDHLRTHSARFNVTVTDRSDDFALIALQGPRAERILAPLSEVPLDALGYYRFLEGSVAGHAVVISRTGYTGEDGFELYLPNEAAVEVWRALLQEGAGEGIAAAGLGARDSLRLEMGYALYGNDLDAERTPLEAGLGWVVKLEAKEFIGRAALVAQKERGLEQRLAGFRLRERGFPRPGYPLRTRDGREGVVTSGIVSPTLGVGIGLGYLPGDATTPETSIEVEIRGRAVPAEIVRPPFYTQGSARS